MRRDCNILRVGFVEEKGKDGRRLREDGGGSSVRERAILKTDWFVRKILQCAVPFFLLDGVHEAETSYGRLNERNTAEAAGWQRWRRQRVVQ